MYTTGSCKLVRPQCTIHGVYVTITLPLTGKDDVMFRTEMQGPCSCSGIETTRRDRWHRTPCVHIQLV